MRICDECGLSPAEVKIVSFVNGDQKTEKYLCKDCAAKLPQKIPGLQLPGFDLGMLSNALGIEAEKVRPQKKPAFSFSSEPSRDITCTHCGTTFDDFRESGLVGCIACYDAFREPMNDLLRRIHGDDQHIGQVPEQTLDMIPEKLRLDKLQRELEAAIATEEYEYAAQIRDEIHALRELITTGKGGAQNA